MHDMRLRRVRRAAAGAAALLLALPASVQAAESPWPGLPPHTGYGGTWLGAAQSGMAETAKAKQWVRTPWQLVAGWSMIPTYSYPSDDPRISGVGATVWIYLVAPAGAEHNYGLAAPFTVRTVAFGVVPVTAKVQLVQERTSDGLPVPLISDMTTNVWREVPPGRPSPYENTDSLISGRLGVRITELVVDGVNLKLRGRCQTRQPGAVALTGKGFWRWTPGIDEAKPWLSGHYGPVPGGYVTGTIDVPSFSGCVTSNGDDVSRLLTASVSGADNEVRMNVSGPECLGSAPGINAKPPPPGAASPHAPGVNCDTSKFPPELPYPDRTP